MIIREGTIHDALEIASVHVKSWQITYSGIIPEDYLNSLDISERVEKWKDILLDRDQKVFVALEGENIVGFATCGTSKELEGYDSTLSSIYLLREYQGRCLGSELFYACKMHLHSLGCQSMYIWVLADNPAKKFYEKMGGEYILKKEIEIGGRHLVEEAHGWNL